MAPRVKRREASPCRAQSKQWDGAAGRYRYRRPTRQQCQSKPQCVYKTGRGCFARKEYHRRKYRSYSAYKRRKRSRCAGQTEQACNSRFPLCQWSAGGGQGRNRCHRNPAFDVLEANDLSLAYALISAVTALPATAQAAQYFQVKQRIQDLVRFIDAQRSKYYSGVASMEAMTEAEQQNLWAAKEELDQYANYVGLVSLPTAVRSRIADIEMFFNPSLSPAASPSPAPAPSPSLSPYVGGLGGPSPSASPVPSPIASPSPPGKIKLVYADRVRVIETARAAAATSNMNLLKQAGAETQALLPIVRKNMHVYAAQAELLTVVSMLESIARTIQTSQDVRSVRQLASALISSMTRLSHILDADVSPVQAAVLAQALMQQAASRAKRRR